MDVSAGTQLGPYQIVAPLGAGGMGRVFRGVDTRLKREVAIKIISAGLADRPAVRERFKTEAMAVASLNHPHICQIYDVGAEQGVDFIVMELVVGETLGARLARSRIPFQHAVRISQQIAQALGAAHDAGIVHRDVKPSNVMLTESGVKLLDFGVARFLSQPGQAFADSTVAPSAQTDPGSAVGTWQYMSPEQLRGEEADRRSDVFSLGCVIYELVSGAPAFSGATHHELLTRIVGAEPPSLGAVAPGLPATFVRVVEMCIEKNVERRWQTAGDVDRALTLVTADRTAGANYRRLIMAAIVLLTIGATAALSVRQSTSAAAVASLTASLDLAPAVAGAVEGSVQFTPDGNALILQMRIPAANRRVSTRPALFKRDLVSGRTTQIEGTDDAHMPFVSPDGRWIGFGGSTHLMKVPSSGGRPVPIAAGFTHSGASWGDDGFIIFGDRPGLGLQRVSAEGGPVTRVTTLLPEDNGEDHRYPEVLPGSRGVLFGIGSGPDENAKIVALDLRTNERKEIVKGSMTFRYSRTGHILYVRGGALYALPFDAGRLMTTGPPTKITNGVSDYHGSPEFAVSASGDLAWVPGNDEGPQRRIALVSMSGAVTQLGPRGPFSRPRFSPDGSKVLVIRDGTKNNIWVHDLRRGTFTQASNGRYHETIWRDDHTFTASQGGPGNLRLVNRRAGIGAKDEPITEHSEWWQTPKDWTRDGTRLIFERSDGVGNTDIWALRPGSIAEPLIATPENEYGVRVSPDGRWLSYGAGSATPRDGLFLTEIYIQPLDLSGPRIQVSVHGGGYSTWSPDSRRLYFRGGSAAGNETAMLAADIDGGADPVRQAPVELFKNPGFAGTYDISPDGKTFVMVSTESAFNAPSLSFIRNWPALLGGPRQP